MHAFTGQFFCKLLGCKTQFSRKRKNQVFCSRECRLKYFSIARALGIKLLEKSRSNESWNAVLDILLKEAMDETESIKRKDQVRSLLGTLDREN